MNINSEQEQILSFYKRLFNYKSVYIFPAITGPSLSPVKVAGNAINEPFSQAKALDWLNFYHQTLTRETLSGPSTVASFFEFYSLDVLYPIRNKDICYGFLGLDMNRRSLNKLEQQIAALIIRYMVSMWQNNDLLQEVETGARKTERLFNEISTLLEVTQALENGGNIQNLLEMIMEKCMAVMGVEAVSLMLLSRDRKSLTFRVALGPKGKDVKPYKIELGRGIAGTVAQTGDSLLIENAYEDSRFDERFDIKSGFKTTSILCVPLMFHNKVIGVVQALNRHDGKAFNENDLRTFKIFASQASLAIQNTRLLHSAIENEKLKTQIQVASQIQHLIVPSTLPQSSHFELAGCYIPSQGVGGDFYTVIPANEHETIFCIADVSGKSVPGALLVSTLHASLVAYLEFTTNIEQVIAKLNSLIIKLSTSERFITLFLAKFDSRTNMLSYISAGHNPQILLRNKKEMLPLKSSGICVGIIPFEYKAQQVELHKNDLIFLFTDGICEARNGENTIYGEARLETLLKANYSSPITSIPNKVVEAVNSFSEGKASLQDDITMLAIRKK